MSPENTALLAPLPCPLYPEAEPYATHMLDVGDGHTLYVEECGNPGGLPVIVIHGGPGSGCRPSHRRRFDPAVYRIICFDQRGAGRSVHAEGRFLHANTTPHLIADMERIRELLGIDAWVLYGTSWGSTLALVYAETYPERVQGMVVGGIFLCNAESFDWFTHPLGVRQLLPAPYAAVQALAPGLEGFAILEHIGHLIDTQDPRAPELVKAMTFYECMAAGTDPQPADIEAYLSTPEATRGSFIQMHYYANRCYLKEDQIMENAPRIGHIPTFILNGALDFVCPPAHAYRLHKALPNSTLTLLPLCGHFSANPYDMMNAARVMATDKMARLLGH